MITLSGVDQEDSALKEFALGGRSFLRRSETLTGVYPVVDSTSGCIS